MRRAALAVLVLATALAGVAWLTTRPVTQREDAPPRGLPPSGTAPSLVPAAAPAVPAAAQPPSPDPGAGSATVPREPLRPYPLDLAQLREVTPGNLYWETGAPTSDPEVAKARAERAKAVNVLYGKVLSGTGTEEEVRTYFAERRKEHEDAVRFAQAALDAGGADLPDQDRGLLLLAIELNAARLAELPRGLEDALARKAEQDRRRAEWRAAGSPVPAAPP
ncbi:MAG: hypothetical protein QM704_04740 [Anaeromyxobacteraceae bacterium]